MPRNRRRRTLEAGSGERLVAEYAAAYDAIGAHLGDVLPVGWSKAWILAEMRKDDGMVVGAVTIGGSAILHWPDLPTQTYELFRRMYTSAACHSPVDVWTSVTFILDESGHLDVAFGYEPRPIGEQLERIAAWVQSIESA